MPLHSCHHIQFAYLVASGLLQFPITVVFVCTSTSVVSRPADDMEMAITSSSITRDPIPVAAVLSRPLEAGQMTIVTSIKVPGAAVLTSTKGALSEYH